MGRPRKKQPESEVVLEEPVVEEKTQLDEESMEIEGLLLKDIKKIDKTTPGMYIIELRDGSKDEYSLDDGQSTFIDHYLSRHLSDDVSESDVVLPSGEKVEIPYMTVNALERSLGNWMDVEFVDPDLGGYWASDEDLPRFLMKGYVYAQPNMIKFYESTFDDSNPGEGLSPDGIIKRNGHTLLVVRKETQKMLHDYYFNKRRDYRSDKFFRDPKKVLR